MAEPNLVPRTNKGASIGTALKQWAHGFFGGLTVDGKTPLLDANNLSDVDDPAAARTNLGVLSRGETLAYTNPRALAPVLHFDKMTTGARAVVPLGAHAAGMTAYTLPFKFTMPTSNPASASGLGGLSANATAIGAGGIGLRLATNGDLQVRFHGATTGDYIQRVVTGARAAYSGQPVEAALVVDSSGPILYINGVDAGLTSETTAGTPPEWTDSPAADYFILGVFEASEIWQGRLSSYGPLNYAKTAAEIADLVRQGPPFADLAGGTIVPLIGPGVRNGDFEDTSGGAGGSPFAHTRAQSAITVIAETTDVHSGTTAARIVGAGASSSSVNNWFLIGSADSISTTQAVWRAGDRVRVEAWVKNVVAGQYLQFSSGYDELIRVAGDSATDWVRVEWEGHIQPRIYSRPVIACFGTWLVDDIVITPLGLIANPTITRTAQLRDPGLNKLHGYITSGVTPLGGQFLPITWTQSATGYILGDNPLIFDPHMIAELWVKPTTSTIPNITLRRAGPSGDDVIASVSAGTEGEWTRLTTIDAAAAGEAGDKYHLTFSTSANCEFRLVPQPL